MDHKTEKPLNKYIKMWESEGHPGLNNPLCTLFYPNCVGCPIHEVSGKADCRGTSIEKLLNHQSEWRHYDSIKCPKCEKLKLEIIDFLKLL